MPAADVERSVSTMRVFDPCIGSGTILAAAAARGFGWLVGSDINSDFVLKATSNLDGCGLHPQGMHTFVHDATTPYPSSLLDPSELADTLVVANPPWGSNIGTESDGVAIVRSVASQTAGATMCWLANSLALQAMRCTAGLTVLRHVPFGSVELVVCTAVESVPVTRPMSSRENV
eukprot:4347925-Prymnesium_polylepis.1